jgi:hypothetical protein
VDFFSHSIYCYAYIFLNILRRIDSLLGKDLGKTIRQQPLLCKTAVNTTIGLLLETVLCNPLLGSCNFWTTTMETEVFLRDSCRGVML